MSVVGAKQPALKEWVDVINSFYRRVSYGSERVWLTCGYSGFQLNWLGSSVLLLHCSLDGGGLRFGEGSSDCCPYLCQVFSLLGLALWNFLERRFLPEYSLPVYTADLRAVSLWGWAG